jgi:hypothetical protein
VNDDGDVTLTSYSKGRRFESHRGQAYFSSLPVWIYTQSNITQQIIRILYTLVLIVSFIWKSILLVFGVKVLPMVNFRPIDSDVLNVISRIVGTVQGDYHPLVQVYVRGGRYPSGRAPMEHSVSPSGSYIHPHEMIISYNESLGSDHSLSVTGVLYRQNPFSHINCMRVFLVSYNRAIEPLKKSFI